jgi:hypothetical protein
MSLSAPGPEARTRVTSSHPLLVRRHVSFSDRNDRPPSPGLTSAPSSLHALRQTASDRQSAWRSAHALGRRWRDCRADDSQRLFRRLSGDAEHAPQLRALDVSDADADDNKPNAHIRDSQAAPRLLRSLRERRRGRR